MGITNLSLGKSAKAGSHHWEMFRDLGVKFLAEIKMPYCHFLSCSDRIWLFVRRISFMTLVKMPEFRQRMMGLHIVGGQYLLPWWCSSLLSGRKEIVLKFMACMGIPGIIHYPEVSWQVATVEFCLLRTYQKYGNEVDIIIHYMSMKYCIITYIHYFI